MDFGDLLQVLIGAAFVLFWLFGGRKKKAQRRPAVQPVDRSGDDLPGELIADSPDLKLTDSERMIREALGLPTELEPVSTATSEAPPVEMFETEAASLETLQVDSQERHSEFHEKYVGELKPTKVYRGAQTAVPEINSSAARKGILWQIILGPPKSLE